MDSIKLQRALQQLLATNMVNMISKPRGFSFESTYEISELARTYLLRHHPVKVEDSRVFARRKAQLTAAGERIRAEVKANPYSTFSIDMSSRSDVIVGKYLLDALVAAIKSRDLEAAEKLVAKARELAPEYFETHRVAGWVQAIKGNYSAARDSYEAAIELEPKHAPLRLWYAGFLLRFLQDLPAALSQLEEAAKLDPASADVQLELARAHLFSQNFAEAKRILEALLARGGGSRLFRSKIYDHYLQYFSRSADHALTQRDSSAAIEFLEGYKTAYDACPKELLDRFVLEKVNKVVHTAKQSYNAAINEDYSKRALQILQWLAKIGEMPADEVPPDQGTPPKRDYSHGTIKMINRKFGFISTGNGPDVFFSARSMVVRSDWHKARRGKRVNFNIEENAKGIFAENVHFIDEANSQRTE